MDAQHFKAPYLRRTDIWKQADELRPHLRRLPVTPTGWLPPEPRMGIGLN
jgi:hypothetical protein